MININFLVKYMIRLLVILTSGVLLQSCATTPQPTLELGDVPVLYEAPSVSEQTVPLVEGEAKTMAIVNSANGSPEIVENSIAISPTDSCTEMANEIDKINAGMGSVAIEEPPNTAWPSAAQRTGEFIYNLAAQTVLGALQPVIQTKRAIFNDDEKDRRLAESVERGQTRRAYLIGYAQASGCDQKVVAPALLPEEVDTNIGEDG